MLGQTVPSTGSSNRGGPIADMYVRRTVTNSEEAERRRLRASKSAVH